MINIKRITELDSELYSGLITLWQAAEITNPARKDSFAAIVQSLQTTGTILIAFRAAEVIGSVWLNHDYRRLYIHHMAVLPELQNTGIGSLLMDEVVEIGRELGYQMKLEVHEDNPAAMHLYAKYGFTELTGYRVFIKRGE